MQPMACNVQYSRLLIDDLGKVIMSCHLTLKSDMLARFSNRLFDLLDFFLKLDCRNFSNTALLELSYLFLAEYKRWSKQVANVNLVFLALCLLTTNLRDSVVVITYHFMSCLLIDTLGVHIVSRHHKKVEAVELIKRGFCRAFLTDLTRACRNCILRFLFRCLLLLHTQLILQTIQ